MVDVTPDRRRLKFGATTVMSRTTTREFKLLSELACVLSILLRDRT